MSCPVYTRKWVAQWWKTCVLFLMSECHIRNSGSACCFCQRPWRYPRLCLTLQTVRSQLNKNKNTQIFNSFRLCSAWLLNLALIFIFHPVIWKIVLLELQSKMWKQSGSDMLIESKSILFMCKNLSSVDLVFQQIITQWNICLLIIFWITIKKGLQFSSLILQFLAGVPKCSRRICTIPDQPEKGSVTSPPRKGYSCWSRKLQNLALCICTNTLQRFLESTC